MAKVKMLKFECAVPKTREKKTLRDLQFSGSVEIQKCKDGRLCDVFSNIDKTQYHNKHKTVSDALNVLSEHGIKAYGGLFPERKELTKTQYKQKEKNTENTFLLAEEILSLSAKIKDRTKECKNCIMKAEQLKIWENCNLPLKSFSTENVNALFGTFPEFFTSELLYEKITSLSKCDENAFCTFSFYSSKQVTTSLIIYHKSIEGKIKKALSLMKFVPIKDEYENNAKDEITLCLKKVSEYEKEIRNAKEKIRLLGKKCEDLLFAYDYYLGKVDNLKCEKKLSQSEATVFFCGFVPNEKSESVKIIINENGGEIAFADVSDNEDAPVILRNGRFSSPCEPIVEMYSLPSKNDIDPTFVTSLFYYLLFGLMLSDAGYGLVVFFVALYILRKKKIYGNMRKTVKMFLFCSVCTIFWGVLFGSWFGDIVQSITSSFITNIKVQSTALWFDPISDPIKLLIISLLIGVLHLFSGLFAHFYTLLKNGDMLGAVFDTFPVVVAVVGAVPLVGSFLVTVSNSVLNVSKYVFIIGCILIVVTGGRTKKSILSKIFSGVFRLYNTASSYLSDILSYSRLLALGLATGSIASVVNMLGTMPQNKIVKLCLFIFVFVLGHTLNLAINLLGAYVHTNRLQFVELYSKFYKGSGRPFERFGLNMKYFTIKEKENNE